MDLGTYSEALRRYWVTFAITGVVVVGLGLTLMFVQPAKYESSTRLLVTIDGATTASAYKSDDAVSARINTYIPLISSSVVTRPVQQKLGSHFSDTEIASRISATRVLPRTALIDVRVSGDSAEQAQALARTVADQFVSYTSAIETATGEDSQKIHTQVVDQASEGRVDRLEQLRLSAIVVLGGILAGLMAVWIRARRRSSVDEGSGSRARAGANSKDSV